MIIKLETSPEQEVIEILIKAPEGNKDAEQIVSMLKSFEIRIEGFSGANQKPIPLSDIYFIESLDNKTIIHCEKDEYQSKLRLYQLDEKLADYGFTQISKYCIVNINKLEKIKTLFNSRMEVFLLNGKRLIVTRKYLNGIKQILLRDG